MCMCVSWAGDVGGSGCGGGLGAGNATEVLDTATAQAQGHLWSER